MSKLTQYISQGLLFLIIMLIVYLGLTFIVEGIYPFDPIALLKGLGLLFLVALPHSIIIHIEEEENK